ncbi:MAG: hypothetical protein ACRDT4_21070 [Micromonosporaceae bacterium]
MDMRELLVVAREKLPDVAGKYLAANRDVADTGYASNPWPGSRVHTYWSDLRDEFQKILGRTADNVADTAAALERVVEAWSATDEEAARILRGLVVEYDLPTQPVHDDLPSPVMPKE